MNKIIIANWKCNPTNINEAKEIFDSVIKGVEKIKNVDVAICPPFVYLSFSALGVACSNLSFGAQDCFWEEKGPYTGEISPEMIKDWSCESVIVGHSERRKHFNETDETVNKKIKSALRAELTPIFCVGETKEERDRGEAENVVKSQIKKGLDKVLDSDFSQGIIIAYEPVWAIGTGSACGATEAKKMAEVIKEKVLGLYGQDFMENVRIVYGGSVNGENSAGYVKEAGFDGLLVGGASLNPEEFVKIVKSAE